MLADLLHESSRPAILASDPAIQPLTHSRLRDFVKSFDLTSYGIRPTERIALLLPDGPSYALCLLAILNRYCAVPLNYKASPSEVASDIKRLRITSIITDDALLWSINACQVTVLHLQTELNTPAGFFSLRAAAIQPTFKLKMSENALDAPQNGSEDTVLVLQTSGTSGLPKVVPYTLSTILHCTNCVKDTWNIKESDININMMPLFHVGGIVRNLLAPLSAGASTIVCQGFDATLFCDLLSAHPVTWYYAAPTMHSAILQEYEMCDTKECALRLICNAAGGLLPSLAKQLQTTFKAVVLPSYGMTECMPISTPPLSYKLDRTGTSGVSAGPEIAIFDSDKCRVSPGVTGNIMVRGGPLFGGYELSDGQIDKSVFDAEGWFDTGDCGYLDHEEYLYLTGRSKEIINRGGEVISPLQVEEAVSKHPSVQRCLAFSVPHNILQEVVGIAIVSNGPRTDLIGLKSFLKADLDPTKWPALIVYMDDLPQNETGKVLRIRLAERFEMKPLTDGASMTDNLYEAICPSKGTSINVKISARPIDLDVDMVRAHLEDLLIIDNELEVWNSGGKLHAVISLPGICGQEQWYRTQLTCRMQEKMHSYLIPTLHIQTDKPILRRTDGSVDFDAFGAKNGLEDMQLLVHDIFIEVLGLSMSTSLAAEDDFFELGGDSLKVGRLVSFLRKRLYVKLSVETIFQQRTIRAIAAEIERLGEITTSQPTSSGTSSIVDATTVCGEDEPEQHISKCSQTQPLVLLFQLLPIVVFYPLCQAAKWTVLIYSMAFVSLHVGAHTTLLRFFSLLVGVLISKASCAVLLPLLAIMGKWLVIGRYRRGLHPLWGSYYMRWWIVDQMLYVTGKGVFGWSSTLTLWYYRLLGASIGQGVKIAKHANIGEFDLITIGDRCRIDDATIRPFCLDLQSQIRLESIVMMEDCVVGLKSHLAPGAALLPRTVMGPLTSSHETQDAREQYRAYCSTERPDSATWALRFLVGYPIIYVGILLSYLPYALGLWALFIVPFSAPNVSDLIVILLIWFAEPSRVIWHFVARVAHHLLAPLVYILYVVAIKRAIIGRIQPGKTSERTGWGHFQRWLMSRLLPKGSLGRITRVIGTHYELTSILYRALGARVGKRVYWPGTGIELSDFDLLHVGDDVVFGSRSAVVTTDADESAIVEIRDGAMIADRCVLLPGCIIGRKAVLGTGGLARKNAVYADGTTWLGSVNGGAIKLAEIEVKEEMPVTTITPFGKAFYQRRAFFWVIPLSMLLCINALLVMSVAIYWGTGAIAATQALAAIQFQRIGGFGKGYARFNIIFCFVFVILSVVLTIQTFMALLLDVAFKWVLLGRRTEGKYDWDQSSYCQRWQLYLALQSVRIRCYGGRGILNLLTGSAWIVWYFRALGADIGRDVCLFGSGRPQLMLTEPDLLTIGDNAAIDDASLVAHINSRGHFALNALRVGKGCVLRSGSRLLSGAEMEDGSMLLEHTLILSGDIADRNKVYQGWPSVEVRGGPTSGYVTPRSVISFLGPQDIREPSIQGMTIVEIPRGSGLGRLSLRAKGLVTWRRNRTRTK